jgi:hypothetical protein
MSKRKHESDEDCDQQQPKKQCTALVPYVGPFDMAVYCEEYLERVEIARAVLRQVVIDMRLNLTPLRQLYQLAWGISDIQQSVADICPDTWIVDLFYYEIFEMSLMQQQQQHTPSTEQDSL